MTCHNCGSEDHFARNCPQKGKGKGSTDAHLAQELAPTPECSDFAHVDHMPGEPATAVTYYMTDYLGNVEEIVTPTGDGPPEDARFETQESYFMDFSAGGDAVSHLLRPGDPLIIYYGEIAIEVIFEEEDFSDDDDDSYDGIIDCTDFPASSGEYIDDSLAGDISDDALEQHVIFDGDTDTEVDPYTEHGLNVTTDLPDYDMEATPEPSTIEYPLEPEATPILPLANYVFIPEAPLP